jgi:hypothetical protein
MRNDRHRRDYGETPVPSRIVRIARFADIYIALYIDPLRSTAYSAHYFIYTQFTPSRCFIISHVQLEHLEREYIANRASIRHTALHARTNAQAHRTTHTQRLSCLSTFACVCQTMIHTSLTRSSLSAGILQVAAPLPRPPARVHASALVRRQVYVRSSPCFHSHLLRSLHSDVHGDVCSHWVRTRRRPQLPRVHSPRSRSRYRMA